MVDEIVIFKKHVSFLTKFLMSKRKSAEEVSAADVLTRTKNLVQEQKRSHEGQPHCFTVAAIPQL